MMASLLFYMFSLVLLAAAAGVVTVRQPVAAVLLLILCFFNASGLFLLMGAEFLAFILLIVYVGAVAVLFLFVVMMLDMQGEKARGAISRYQPLGLGLGGVLLLQMMIVVATWPEGQVSQPVGQPTGKIENTVALGRVLYTDYAYPFQIAGLILLVAMAGAIVLTLRRDRPVKRQEVWSQLDRRREDVVEIRQVKSGEGAL